MVYVDESKYTYGRMVMCHMTADTLQELFDMADVIGADRKWFQSKTLPHFDICKSKRDLAVRNGAIETDSKNLVKIARKLRRELL